ncbi:MAG: coenzyme F420-0:L-glutamate ligase [Chlamydiales bacterium]|nr:coenzyme F420-0:L-glutamate ligase [Chlamydiales bacterium]
MHIKTYKTHKITEKDSLFHLIDSYVPKLKERSIFVVTSKIISLCEGSIVEKKEVESKEALIQKSADAYLNSEDQVMNPCSIQLTIKNNILIPSAGIDESNGNGVYILYPKNIQQSAASIWEYVRYRDELQELGVLITDSHPTPMRRGVIGIGLGWCGFRPLYNYIGKPDCFGLPLQVTMRNNLDGLAAATVFCMGEGNEQTPFAVVTNAPKLEFQLEPPVSNEVQGLSIPMDEDLYAPLLKNASWIFKNHHGKSLN